MNRDTKLNQATALLDFLFTHQSITVSLADRLLHIGDPRSVIRDLRHRGWPILDIKRHEPGYYGRTSNFKEYYLADCKDCAHYRDAEDGCEYCALRQEPITRRKGCQGWCR